MSRSEPRSALRRLSAVMAFVLAAAAVLLPWYADLPAVRPQAPDQAGFSGAGSVLGYLNLYAAPEPPSWLPATVVVVKVVVLAMAAAIVAAAFRLTQRGRVVHAGALVVVAIAAGASLYVRLSDAVLRDDGLTLLWGAAIAFTLLAATAPAARGA